MAALFKQPEWSIEEVVLLALASEDVAAMKVSLDDAAIALSQRLRCGAELMGVSIGQRYRNNDEVRNNLKLMASMTKMIGYLEDDYFSGSTIGQIALLAKRDRNRFHALADRALEFYPVIVETADAVQSAENYDSDENSSSEDYHTQVVAEPAPRLSEQTGVVRKRRPRIYETHQRYNLNKYESDATTTSVLQTEQSYSIEASEKQEFDASAHRTYYPDYAEVIETSKIEPQTSYQKYLALIKQVLAQYFKRGFRLNSPIDLKRFRAYYKTMHGKNMQFTDDSLEDYIRRAGFEYDGKIYLTEKVADSHFAEEIRDYIRSVFMHERDYIFYKALYAHFEDEFLDSQIADVDMLKCWLQVAFAKDFAFTKHYVARSSQVVVSVKEEVETFVRESQSVVNLEQLKNALDFLPLDKVQQEWNSIDEFITNGRNEKFHIDTFLISIDEREKVALLISTYLQDNPFITGDALIDELRMNLPEMFDNNASLSSLGVRNAIAYHLKDRFAFRNNIISDKNDELDGAKAMVAFCRNRGYFTMEDAEGMADVIGSALNVYLEHISKVAIRVNDTDFVPINEIVFDTEGIDKALDIYISGDFAPFISIEHFEAFPACGEYPWNLRLLESYLLTANSRYAYYHSTFLAKGSIAGAIVKKNSSLKSYEDVLVQALGEADIILYESSANDYLYEKGLIARRQKNGPVKGLLMKAKECRNRLTQKKS